MKQITVRFKNGGRYQPNLPEEIIRKIDGLHSGLSMNGKIKTILRTVLYRDMINIADTSVEVTLCNKCGNDKNKIAGIIRKILEDYFKE
jgi:hypothetical protein